MVDDLVDTQTVDGIQNEEIEVIDDDDDVTVHDDVDYSDVIDEWQHQQVVLGLDDDDETIVLVLRFGVVAKKCDDDCEYLVI